MHLIVKNEHLIDILFFFSKYIFTFELLKNYKEILYIKKSTHETVFRLFEK